MEILPTAELDIPVNRPKSQQKIRVQDTQIWLDGYTKGPKKKRGCLEKDSLSLTLAIACAHSRLFYLRSKVNLYTSVSCVVPERLGRSSSFSFSST